MTDSQMLYNVEDHVATITFNRPDQQNTISGSMLNRFSKLLLEADSDADVRAIVITGTGKFFCAGLDLRGSDITDNLSSERSTPTTLDLKNTPPTVLHNLDTPTIAALNGSAAGYGMDLALGCDIRIMADHAKLAAAFTARGVVPESGGTWILPRLIGWSRAREMIFTGKTLSATECKEMGLVSHIVNNNKSVILSVRFFWRSCQVSNRFFALEVKTYFMFKTTWQKSWNLEQPLSNPKWTKIRPQLLPSTCTA